MTISVFQVSSLFAQEATVEKSAQKSIDKEIEKKKVKKESKKELKKSVQLKLLDQFQMVVDLGKWTVKEANGSKDKNLQKGDIFFQNRRLHVGLQATYGIFTLDFSTKVDNDKGVGKIGVNTATASLKPVKEVGLSFGKITLPVRGDSQASGAILGIESFLLGLGDDVMNFGVNVSGLLANDLFGYTFSIFHGYQDLKKLTVSKFDVPGLAMQLRFHIFRNSVIGEDYFLGQKQFLTIGVSAVYQALPLKYYGFKADKAEENNLLHFDLFLQGDILLGDNSLPFLLVYEHVAFNPFVSKEQTQDSVHFGRLTMGIGFYINSIKLMPSIRYVIDLYQRNKEVYDGHGLDNTLEITFAYFPFGHSLNLKMGYIFESNTKKEKKNNLSITTHSHKIITQVQMLF